MPANQITTASNEFDAVVAKHSLLKHPFYVAWSMGTLPVAALKGYASEYGAFIATISQGWRAAGEQEIAGIEDGHSRVWEQSFAASLNTSVAAPQVPEVVDLVALAGEMFGEYATALGALYAFEVQQPFTAQSKLKGLGEHYAQLPERCADYFRMHAADYDEPALLSAKIDALNPGERQRALEACERMSQALYQSLSGIHASFLPN
jgi:pyrroloquinoline-quinone synthase